MQVHEFTAGVAPLDECEAVIGGRVCGDAPEDRIHKFIASYGCYHPTVTVQLFVNMGKMRFAGIHYATLFWQAEDEDSWFSAWYAAHNDPSKYRRLESLDCRTAAEVSAHVQRVIARDFTIAQLEEMGVKNS